jgi:hypothetical protein
MTTPRSSRKRLIVAQMQRLLAAQRFEIRLLYKTAIQLGLKVVYVIFQHIAKLSISAY